MLGEVVQRHQIPLCDHEKEDSRHWDDLTYINAWKVVLTRDFLSTQMFLYGERMIRTTLDGGIVNNDNTLTAGNSAYACDHSGTRNWFDVYLVCGQSRKLQERRMGV